MKFRRFGNLALSLAAVIWILYVFRVYLPQIDSTLVPQLLSDFGTEVLRFGLLDIVIVVWISLVAYVVGNRLLHYFELEYDSSAERIAFSTAAGLSLLSLAAFCLAATKLFYDLEVFALLAVPSLFCFRELGGIAKKALSTSPFRSSSIPILALANGALISYLIFNLSIVLVSALGPEIEYDALVYHLPAANAIVQSHYLRPIPDIPMAFFPKNIEMLFALAMGLHSEITAKVLQYLLGLLVILATYALAKRMSSRTCGLMAAAILVSTPIFLWEMRTSYVEVGLGLYVLLALYSILLWLETDKKYWFWLAVWFMAFSLGIKYYALFSLGGLALIIFAAGLAKHRDLSRSVRDSAIFVLCSCLGMLPWAAVNLIQTGNPVFPLLNGIFHSPYWTHSLTESIESELWAAGVATLSDPWPILRTYWAIVADQRAQYHGNIGAFYLLLAPLPLFFRRLPSAIKLVCGLAAIYWLCWVFTGPYVRFLIPILPAMAVVAAWALHEWLMWVRVKAHAAFAIVSAVALAILAIFSTPLFEAYGAGSRYGNGIMGSIPWNYLVGQETREQYLNRFLKDYEAVAYLNVQPGPQKKVMFWWNTGPIAFYTDGDICFVHSPIFEKLVGNDPEELIKQLEENGVTHVVIGREGQDGSFFSDPEKDFVQRYLKKLYQKNSTVLYEVSYKPLQQEIVAYDFLNHISEATISMPSEPPGKEPGSYRIVPNVAGDWRYSLLMRLSAEVGFELTLPARPVMRFAIGRMWSPCTSKGIFQLSVRPAAGTQRTLFEQEISEPNPSAESGWYEHEVDLAAYAGQPVTVMFRTSGQTAGTCEWFLWADPQIISRPPVPDS